MNKEFDPSKVIMRIGGEDVVGFADGEVITMERDEDFTPTSTAKIKTDIKEIRYDVIGAGPVGHPEEIFQRIARHHGFDILKATPHTIGDCWIFKVQMYNTTILGYLPSYIKIIGE